MGMIAQQPNGLYCRISTIVDAPTFENKTKEELEDYLEESNQIVEWGKRLSVDEWLRLYERPWEDAVNAITTLNMTQKEIDDWLKLTKE